MVLPINPYPTQALTLLGRMRPPAARRRMIAIGLKTFPIRWRVIQLIQSTSKQKMKMYPIVVPMMMVSDLLFMIVMIGAVRV
jgi:hypothetical protein